MFRILSYRFWLYLNCCILIYSCSVVPDQLKTADKLIETDPDSALHILVNIPHNQIKTPSFRALYGLLFIKALDKQCQPLKPDSLLDFSLNYYLIHNDDEKLATCYLYKGRKYKYGMQYEKAMTFYLKGLDISYPTKNDLLLGRFNFDLGDIYLLQHDYKLARQKYELSFDYFTKIKFKTLAFYSLLNIGRTYHASGDYKKAQRFYNKVSRYTTDSLEKASLLQEKAINFYDNHLFDSAMIYFREVLHYPYIGNNRAVRNYYFADLFLDLKQIDSAAIYAKNALTDSPDVITKRECYRILSNTGYLRGNSTLMSLYMNKYVVMNDSVHKIESQTKGSTAEYIHISTMKVIKIKTINWYMLIIILSVITVGFFLYIYLKKRNTLNIQMTEIYYKQQKAEVRKNALFKHRETLLTKIETLKTKQSIERKKASLIEKEQFDRKMYDEFLHLNDIDYFYQEMDTMLNNLVSKLYERYPSISSKEICWCCLHLLDIPVIDIYMLLEYKVGSLKKMKQRLAQKINVNGIKGIEDFLMGILIE
jgi:tetratricopeptide (TPR) repeat protein